MSIEKDFSKEKFLSLKVADLPDLCYTYVESTHEIAIIKKGEIGYFPSVIDTSNMTKEECIAYVDEQNEILEVSPEEAEMMSLKSMFGWVDGKKEEAIEQPNEDLLTEAKKTLTIGVKRPIKLEIVDKEDLPAGYKLTPEQELDALDQIQNYLEKTMLEEPEWLHFNGMQFSLNYIELDDHLKASFNVDTSRTEDYARKALEEFIDSIPENLRPTHVVGVENESEPCLVELVILDEQEETLTEDVDDSEEVEETEPNYDETDSALNEMLTEMVDTNALYKRVVEEIIEDAEDYGKDTLRERIQARTQDILSGGLVSGIVSSLIYYSDTTEFYNTYEDEIYDFIEYLADNGLEPIEAIKRQCSEAEILTQTDNVKNWVVWLVYEEIAYILDAKLIELQGE